jgi:hypothetical protein
MAILRLLPNAPHFREFQNDEVTGHHYTNTCGETMLAELMVMATPKIESTAEAISLMTALTRDMMAKGWADKPNGATQTGYLYLEARAKGFTVASPYVRWQDPINPDSLHAWLRQYAGIKPIGLMVTNGQALRAVDGSHDEVGLHGHFIAIVGLADEGYITEDGDNSAITDHLVIYPWAAIEAAHVTGFIMLEPQEVASVGVPKGWTDDGTTLKAPDGTPVIKGFRNYILANVWNPDDYPLAGEFASDSIEPGNAEIGAGSRQDFRLSSLGWTTKLGVYRVWLGQDVVAQRKTIAAQSAKLDAVRKAVA